LSALKLDATAFKISSLFGFGMLCSLFMVFVLINYLTLFKSFAAWVSIPY